MLFAKVFSLWLSAATLVRSQRLDGLWYPCDPTRNKTGACVPDHGLPSPTYSIDFTKQTALPQGWTISNYATVNYGSLGAEFTFKKHGDSPQIWTDWYMLGCRYEVEMRVANGTGIISSSVLVSNSYDEFDLEFSGNDFNHPGGMGANGLGQNNYFGLGRTGNYDRGMWFNVTTPQYTFHKYYVDWNQERTVWGVDGKDIRTLWRKDCDEADHRYPQSPSKLQLGLWDGGGSDMNAGTIAWSGGLTDVSKAPYTFYVKNLVITNYNPACAYNWTDQTGRWESIQIITDQKVCNSIYGSSTTTHPTSTAGAKTSSPQSTVPMSTIAAKSPNNQAAASSGLAVGPKTVTVIPLPFTSSTSSKVAVPISSSTLSVGAKTVTVVPLPFISSTSSKLASPVSSSVLNKAANAVTTTSISAVQHASTSTSSASVASSTPSKSGSTVFITASPSKSTVYVTVPAAAVAQTTSTSHATTSTVYVTVPAGASTQTASASHPSTSTVTSKSTYVSTVYAAAGAYSQSSSASHTSTSTVTVKSTYVSTVFATAGTSTQASSTSHISTSTVTVKSTYVSTVYATVGVSSHISSSAASSHPSVLVSGAPPFFMSSTTSNKPSVLVSGAPPFFASSIASASSKTSTSTAPKVLVSGAPPFFGSSTTSGATTKPAASVLVSGAPPAFASSVSSSTNRLSALLSSALPFFGYPVISTSTASSKASSGRPSVLVSGAPPFFASQPSSVGKPSVLVSGAPPFFAPQPSSTPSHSSPTNKPSVLVSGAPPLLASRSSSTVPHSSAISKPSVLVSGAPPFFASQSSSTSKPSVLVSGAPPLFGSSVRSAASSAVYAKMNVVTPSAAGASSKVSSASTGTSTTSSVQYTDGKAVNAFQSVIKYVLAMLEAVLSRTGVGDATATMTGASIDPSIQAEIEQVMQKLTPRDERFAKHRNEGKGKKKGKVESKDQAKGKVESKSKVRGKVTGKAKDTSK